MPLAGPIIALADPRNQTVVGVTLLAVDGVPPSRERAPPGRSDEHRVEAGADPGRGRVHAQLVIAANHRVSRASLFGPDGVSVNVRVSGELTVMKIRKQSSGAAPAI